MSVRVGILDSGIDDPELMRAVVGSRDLTLHGPAGPCLPHGATIARIVLGLSPDAVLLDARIFGGRLATSAEQAAAGLDWLVQVGSRIVNMSLGLREDRAALAQACHAAMAAGVILVAASPSRGPSVFPAAYPGVLRVCGDARCAPGQVSALGGEPAEFGACARPSPAEGEPYGGGSSFAAAQVTGVIAGFLAQNPDAESDTVRDHLHRIAAFHGRERRLA